MLNCAYVPGKKGANRPSRSKRKLRMIPEKEEKCCIYDVIIIELYIVTNLAQFKTQKDSYREQSYLFDKGMVLLTISV